ncbi:unnamed protein product [Closterium sp. NIES-64]|nr:unnamed protein product [Closterium sp. NIES-64]
MDSCRVSRRRLRVQPGATCLLHVAIFRRVAFLLHVVAFVRVADGLVDCHNLTNPSESSNLLSNPSFDTSCLDTGWRRKKLNASCDPWPYLFPWRALEPGETISTDEFLATAASGGAKLGPLLTSAGATLAEAIATAAGAASAADVSINNGVTGVTDTLLAADGSRFLRLTSAISASLSDDDASGSSNGSNSSSSGSAFGGPGVAQALCELKPAAAPTINVSQQAQQQQQQQSPRQLSLSFFARASLCAEGEEGAEGEAERLLKVLLLAVPLNASGPATAGGDGTTGGGGEGGAGEQVWAEWRVGVPCGGSRATNPSPLKCFSHWPLSRAHPLLTAGSARRNSSSLALTTLSDLNSAALALHPAPFALLAPATPASPCRPFSFSTSFAFRISSPNAAGLGGEGLAFVMLPTPTLGLPGPSLGYGRVPLPPGSTTGADHSSDVSSQVHVISATNPFLRVAQPSISLARPSPSLPFPPSAVIAPSSPADPTAATASPPPVAPPPLPFFFPPPRLLRRRLRIPPRHLVAASSSPCRNPPRRRLPPSCRRAYFGVARAPLCRDAPSPPPPIAAEPPSAPPAHPASATPRRRLPSRRRDFASPPARPVVASRPAAATSVAACTPRQRELPSPPTHPAAATRSSPPARPAAATSCRRLRIPPPRPSRRRLRPLPPRPPVVARATSCRGLLVAARASRPAAASAASAAAAAAAEEDLHSPSPFPPPPPRPPPSRLPRVDPPSPSPLTAAGPPAAVHLQAAAGPPALAADRSAINWHSFVGSIRRVLQDAFVGPYCVIDVLLRRPQALQPTAPNHPGEPPPPPIPPGPPPTEPTLEIATTPALQDAADAAFLHDRREYLIRKAEHEVAVHNHDFAVAERANRLALLDEYNAAMADYLPRSIAWATADNRACTVLLGALPGTLMRRFQAREMRASLIWAELQAMFERRDISSVGALFQEYFSITLATCDGAVDYVGRMQEVADRLAARQTALPEPLQIHRLLYNLTPDYESRLHAFTEANPMAGLDDVVHRATRVVATAVAEAVVEAVVVVVAVVAVVAVVPVEVVLAAPLLEDLPVLVVL